MPVNMPLKVNAEVQILPAPLLDARGKWIWFRTHEPLPLLVYVWVIARSQVWIPLELLYLWKTPLHSKVRVKMISIKFINFVSPRTLNQLMLFIIIFDALRNPPILEWLRSLIWILGRIWRWLIDGWVRLHIDLYDFAVAIIGGFNLSSLLSWTAVMLEDCSMLLSQIRIYFENRCRRWVLHSISWCICFQLLEAWNKFSRLLIHRVLTRWLLASFNSVLQVYGPRVVGSILLHLRQPHLPDFWNLLQMMISLINLVRTRYQIDTTRFLQQWSFWTKNVILIINS